MAVHVIPILYTCCHSAASSSLKHVNSMSLLCESCVCVISNVLGDSYRQSLFRKSVIVGKMSAR